jgi:KDO2-lipid IV(A) lauroyltransferase
LIKKLKILNFSSIKNLPILLAFGMAWLITQLPHLWCMAVGRGIGRLFYRFAHRRRRIALINLTLCFPELTDDYRLILLKKHFESLGMGLFEMFSAWWLPDNRLKFLAEIQGLEHLQDALARGKGVILLGSHFTSMEIGSRFIVMHTAFHAVYRSHENSMVEWFMKKNRERHAEKAIPRELVREMLRSLKNNKTLWFAADQNFGHKGSIFADFFGIPAATNTAPIRLAEISGATVVPFFTQRLDNGKNYKIILLPALENFPSGNIVKDTLRINQLIEFQIKQAPEQYLWVHRRFKDRPNNESSFYDTESI